MQGGGKVTAPPYERDFNAPPPLPGGTFLKVAQGLAKIGLPVFPCSPETKAPLISGGFKRATTDLQVIAEWAVKYPNAMVGIPTGEVSGVTAVDLDPRCDVTAEQMLPGVPETRIHGTPSGGFHILFRYTPEVGTIGAGVIPLPPGVCKCEKDAKKKCGIDFRNDGGYVVAPGSVRADGVKYTVLSKAPLAEMPAEIIAKLREGKREKSRALAAPAGTGEGMIPEGQRNQTLTSLAGTMRNRGMDAETIEAALLIQNQKRCNPPLPDSEIIAIAASIGSYPPGDSNPPAKLNNSFNSFSSQGEVPVISQGEISKSMAEAIPFPADSLPDVVRRYCEEAAAAIGVPVEMIAAPLLAYAGATIGNRQRIQLKTGFVQYPQSWIVTVAPPGAAKSPADDHARMPIDILQSEAKQKFDLADENFRREMVQWKDAPAEFRGAAPVAPELEHFYSTDTTIEALSRILEFSCGIALSRDEIVGWVNSMDAYKGGKGAERQSHLSGWSGTPIKVDRKTSKTLLIEHPVVAVVGGVQPDVMHELAVEAGRRDGFMERILWVVPKVKPSRWSEDEVSKETSSALLSLFRGLRHPETSPSPVTLSRGAYKLWASWYDENQDSISDSIGMMKGVYAKMPLQLARITLIIHCLEFPDSPSSRRISAGQMAAAIKLVEYFRAQAGIALLMVGQGGVYRGSGTTARVFQILSKANGEWCSRTKIHQDLGGHAPADEISKSLAELEGESLAEKRKPEVKSTPGRRGEEWRITSSELNELNELISLEPAENAENGVITEVTI